MMSVFSTPAVHELPTFGDNVDMNEKRTFGHARTLAYRFVNANILVRDHRIPCGQSGGNDQEKSIVRGVGGIHRASGYRSLARSCGSSKAKGRARATRSGAAFLFARLGRSR